MTTNIHNPLLDRLRIPGETFKLPSQGLFYDEQILDVSVVNGEVEIYPMTALDEIVLSTPDKLLSGKAISDVFSRCIPQIKNTPALLAKDVDFLMVCLRMVTFGSNMDVLFTHTCKNAKEHSYSINLQDMIRKAKHIDPTTICEEYTCVIPNGQKVYLKPMTYGDIVILYQQNMIKKTEEMTEKEMETLIISTIVGVISRVDDVVDRGHIAEWVSQLPLNWKKQVQAAVQQVSDWGLDMKVTQICPDCKKPTDIQIYANPVSFFF